jgi:hypothetical protein
LGLPQRVVLAEAAGEPLEEGRHQPGRVVVGDFPEAGDDGPGARGLKRWNTESDSS